MGSEPWKMRKVEVSLAFRSDLSEETITVLLTLLLNRMDKQILDGMGVEHISCSKPVEVDAVPE